MKQSIDTKLALYPTPVTVIGTMNGDKPTWTLVAHIGINGHDRILVSRAEPHYINHLIKENGRLSINLVTEEMLPAADVSGSVTGAKDDKSDLFEYELWAAEVNTLTEEHNTMSANDFAAALAHSLKNYEQLLKLLAMNHYDMEENSRLLPTRQQSLKALPTVLG